jgi:hypothetical protein
MTLLMFSYELQTIDIVYILLLLKYYKVSVFIGAGFSDAQVICQLWLLLSINS